MTPSAPVTAFISYQRDDTPLAAHLLQYAIQAGGHRAFIDTAGIQGGSMFKETILNSLLETQVVLAVVGERFRIDRLRSPDDYVAFEWRTAGFRRVLVVPVIVGVAQVPLIESLPPELRFVMGANAYRLTEAGLTGEVARLVGDLPRLARHPYPRRRVLWIDDVPTHNERERRHLRRTLGLAFESVVSTAEASDALDEGGFDLIITDYSRPESEDRSRRAGETFLERFGAKGPPVIVYTSPGLADRMGPALVREGAFGVTGSPGELEFLVRKALGDPGAV